MAPTVGSGDGAVRSSINGLTDAARTARDETGEVADAIRAAMDGLGRISASVPRHEARALESAMHDITGDMLRTIEHLEQEVTSTIEGQVAELESLLRPAGSADPAESPPTVDDAVDDDDAPPLPPLDDLEAIKGTCEWAEIVVERYPRLTVDEVLAIYHYTTVEGVERMNGHLRNPERTPEADRATIQEFIDDATSGLTKLPKRPGVTYRGTKLPAHILPLWQVDAVVQDRAFYSSSVEAGVAEGFRRGGNALITITGRTGVDVQALSYFGHESEILFRPGTELRVLSKAWNDGLMCWEFEVVEVTR